MKIQNIFYNLFKSSVNKPKTNVPLSPITKYLKSMFIIWQKIKLIVFSTVKHTDWTYQADLSDYYIHNRELFFHTFRTGEFIFSGT